MFLNPRSRPNGSSSAESRAQHNLEPTNPEIKEWFESRQRRRKPVRTTTTPSGQILDWVPIESQVPDGRIATPPSMSAMPSVARDETVGRIYFELEDGGIERGPSGTVPLLRKDTDALHATESLKEYLAKRGGARVNRDRPHNRPADPNPFGYFHGTSGQNLSAAGSSTWLAVWDPYVETSSDHSIMQCGLQNYDQPLLQSLEAGWTVDYRLNGDWNPHLFIYYTTNGYTQDGDNIGGYNQDVDGWIQVSNSIYPGAGFQTPYSSINGPQLGFQLVWYLDYSENNWWLRIGSGEQAEWLGYYPCWLFFGAPGESLFTTLGAEAEWVGFWGEVYSALPTPTNSTTQMGSGNKAEAGFGKACFQKNLLVFPGGTGAWEDQNGSGSAEDPAKYDIILNANSGGSWGSYFYAGGK